MTIDELIPSIDPLSHAEKIRLLQMVLQKIVQEEEQADPRSQASEHFDPKRFYGAARHSRDDIDQYLASARDGCNE